MFSFATRQRRCDFFPQFLQASLGQAGSASTLQWGVDCAGENAGTISSNVTCTSSVYAEWRLPALRHSTTSVSHSEFHPILFRIGSHREYLYVPPTKIEHICGKHLAGRSINQSGLFRHYLPNAASSTARCHTWSTLLIARLCPLQSSH
jgi:hypothetical protein